MGNTFAANRALNFIRSKLIIKQLNLPLVKKDTGLNKYPLIVSNKITALVPIMPPNRGRAAKASSATSVAMKSKSEKNNDADSEIENDDVEMAVDVKKKPTAKGKKKEVIKENGQDEKPKFGRGRKKIETQEIGEKENDIVEDPPKVSAKGKKKLAATEESNEETETRKSSRAKKKEEDKDETTKGRKKADGKLVEKKSEEKSAKRGKKAKNEENGVKDEEEKLPVKRAKKATAAKESVQEVEDAEEVEKLPVKRGKKPKAGTAEVASEAPKASKGGKAKREHDEGDEEAAAASTAKKSKNDQKKPMNKTDTNLFDIDFSCDKENAKGEKYNIKICSWNVSGMRSVMKKNGIDYVRAEDADIVLLQEIKCDVNKIPPEWKLPGYKHYFLDSNKPGYAGIALYTKTKPIEIRYGLDKAFDDEGRLITAEFDNFYLLNVYVPNAGRGLVNLDKRMEWNAAFKEYVKELDGKKPVVICGDMNVAHQEVDLTNPKTNTKNAGFSKEERDGMTDFLSAGFVDTFRELYPEKTGAYTFWSYMQQARSKNIGWRLDYFIVSSRIKDNICDNVMRSAVYGSDHCPVVLYANL